MKVHSLANLKWVAVPALAGFACLANSAPLHKKTAKQQVTSRSPQGLLDRKLLLGNWGGYRSTLEDKGIKFSSGYKGEFGKSLSGGIKSGGSGYASQIYAGFYVNLKKLTGKNFGTFHFNLDDRFGTGVKNVGSNFPIEEVNGGQFFRITNISYKKTFLNDLLQARVGYYPFGNYYGKLPMMCKFETGAICGHIKTIPFGSVGWSDYPTPTWGGSLRVNFRQDAYGQIGLFDANPNRGKKDYAFNLGFSGSTGVTIPIELGYTPAFDNGKLPGYYKLGGYFGTSNRPDVANHHKTRNNLYGIYALAEQTIFSLGENPKSGVRLFFGGGWSDPKVATYTESEIAGLIVQGFLKSRPDDFVDFGYFRSQVNSKVIAQQTQVEISQFSNGLISEFHPLASAETDYEVGYHAQLTPWLALQPNVQYRHQPGAFSYRHISDNWAFGLKTTVKF